ncbi:hypothetical protein EDB89DRAFT_1905894 [Lactarius sanguifluus]|nr:hypothetical protein EDB89DRAFT_1905894 [Lactarius sanguifluus]
MTHQRVHTTSKTALNIAHFFTDVNSPDPGKGVQRACRLCIEKYSDDKQKTQEKTSKNVPNYFYAKSTANNNLRRHLTTNHRSEYDAVGLKFKWKYKLLTQSGGVSIPKDASNVHLEVPPFSLATFLEYLIRFIVAGDHMREAVINHWQGSFEVLKSDLAVV